MPLPRGVRVPPWWFSPGGSRLWGQQWAPSPRPRGGSLTRREVWCVPVIIFLPHDRGDHLIPDGGGGSLWTGEEAGRLWSS